MKFTRKAEADWNGSIMDGNGKVKLGSGAFEGAYSFQSRFSRRQRTKSDKSRRIDRCRARRLLHDGIFGKFGQSRL